jgi:hypothetical protein
MFYGPDNRIHFIHVYIVSSESDLSSHFLLFPSEFLKHKESGWRDWRIFSSVLRGRVVPGIVLLVCRDSPRHTSCGLSCNAANFGNWRYSRSSAVDLGHSALRMIGLRPKYRPSTEMIWVDKTEYRTGKVSDSYSGGWGGIRATDEENVQCIANSTPMHTDAHGNTRIKRTKMFVLIPPQIFRDNVGITGPVMTRYMCSTDRGRGHWEAWFRSSADRINPLKSVDRECRSTGDRRTQTATRLGLRGHDGGGGLLSPLSVFVSVLYYFSSHFIPFLHVSFIFSSLQFSLFFFTSSSHA